VPALSSTKVTLTFNGPKAALGVNSLNMHIASNDPDTPDFKVPIKLTVANAWEADVAPRSAGGDGRVDVSDWVQIARFAAGLDTPANGLEFQKADCAPKASSGDGKLDVNDWVQAGRYAAGLDNLLPAVGPTAP